MDRQIDWDKKQNFVRAQHVAQRRADEHDTQVNVVEIEDNIFHTFLPEAIRPEDEVIWTAYPTITENLSKNWDITYNRHEVTFVSVRKFIDDDGEEAVMETVSQRWSVEYAEQVQAFLNKVLEVDQEDPKIAEYKHMIQECINFLGIEPPSVDPFNAHFRKWQKSQSVLKERLERLLSEEDAT